MKKVAFHTLGCKLNYSETSTIERQFRDRGFTIVNADEPSDVFVLNTCSVTERADRECRQLIRRALRRSPETFVIVTGCYAQLQPGEIGSIHGVDLILGTDEKFNIFRHEQTFTKRSLPQHLVSCIDDVTAFDPAFSAEEGGRTRAFLKVQDGCDYSCAFCTIPLARGASRSDSITSIVERATVLGRLGYREVVLTGVNVGDFGAHTGTSLLALLRKLEGVGGVDRFRVSSIEPNLLSPALIDFMVTSPKFCRHFHVPLQSGSDTILRGMRRRYTTALYRDVVDRIRSLDATSGIGADVIVGFPGETDALFMETYRFLAELPVSYLHVFTYSEREQTPAAGFGEVVEPRVRHKRSEALRNLGRTKRRAFHAALVGHTRDVLFEKSERDGSFSGYTTEYARVVVRSGQPVGKRLSPARIVGANEEYCSGIIHENSDSLQGEGVSEPLAHTLRTPSTFSQEPESA